MSLPVLQGLGDGVVIFLGILVALVVIVFAWWSTNVAETRVVGVIYLSTSHFNRLLQHLRQTPAPAPGHSATFLTPSVDHNSDSVDALSVARSVPASSDPIHDTPPTSVDVKRDETSSVPGGCSDQSVDAQDDTRSSHLQECSVATSRDVCVDAQTAGSHLHSESCTDLGTLHSTPRGMVLEGCTHMDSRMVDGWWTEASMDQVDDERANSVVQTIQQPTNPITNRQHLHHNTDITDIGSSSYLAQASRNVHENHEGESDEDGHILSGGHGGVDDTLEAAQSDDNNVQQNTTSCRACLNLPGASSVSSRDQNTNTASKIYNHELHECGEFTDMNKAFEENVASVTSSESLLATGESIAVGCSNPADAVLTRNVLRTRQVQAGYVTVRLKYLDDQQRDVQTRLEDTVADFKRQHFAAELSANCTVRFVHNGQELRGDTATLRSFNVVDKSVIHCWLSRPTPPASAAGTGSSSVAAAAATQLDFGCLVLPLLAMLLLLVWYCRFSYHIYFSAVSTFCLVAMTLVFAVCMFVSLQFGDDAIDEVAM